MIYMMKKKEDVHPSPGADETEQLKLWAQESPDEAF